MAANDIIGDSMKDVTEDSGVYDWIVDIDMISNVSSTHFPIFENINSLDVWSWLASAV